MTKLAWLKRSIAQVYDTSSFIGQNTYRNQASSKQLAGLLLQQQVRAVELVESGSRAIGMSMFVELAAKRAYNYYYLQLWTV